jgi:hypothetical protein
MIPASSDFTRLPTQTIPTATSPTRSWLVMNCAPRRRATITSVRASLNRSELSEDDLWGWLQALNALRLVVGTRLGIQDDHHDRPPLSGDDPLVALWDVYDFTGQVQYFVVLALSP